MRKAICVGLIVLCGCTHHYYPSTPWEEMAQKCTDAGYKGQEREDCITAAMKAYDKEVAKEQAEQKKDAERARKAQLAADKVRCKEYGLKYGTKDFANCMMKIEAARNNAQVVRQAATQQRTIPPDVQAKLNNLAYLRSVDNGTTRTTGALLGRLAQGRDEAAIKSELLQNGWDMNSINQLLQSSLPPPAPAPATIHTTNCYPTVGNGFSCTEW